MRSTMPAESVDSARFRLIYIGLWVAVFEAMALLVIAMLIRPREYLPWFAFPILALNVPAVQRIVHVLMALGTSPHDLPKRDHLCREPAVALLYCTCDDVVLACLMKLKAQTYSNCTIFVLDDSQSESSRRLIDATGLRVIRRGTRKGFKARLPRLFAFKQS